jgi:hypothetical protein
MASTRGWEVLRETVTIPTVIYQGSSYSARMGLNGSCFVVEDLTPKASQTALTHEGFDFSAGAAPAKWDATDGYITVWTTRDYPAGYAYGGDFWCSLYDSSGSETPIKDIGEVALSSATNVPTDWTYVSGSGVYPLTANHVYVVIGPRRLRQVQGDLAEWPGICGREQLGSVPLAGHRGIRLHCRHQFLTQRPQEE